jgi:hypothetical protein
VQSDDAAEVEWLSQFVEDSPPSLPRLEDPVCLSKSKNTGAGDEEV